MKAQVRLENSRPDVGLSKARLPDLRLAIRTCEISFPAQVPAFSRQFRADAQWRIAALYLVHGWSFDQLAQRYVVTPSRIRQVIRRWVERAAALGYLERIPQAPRHSSPMAIATETRPGAINGSQAASQAR